MPSDEAKVTSFGLLVLAEQLLKNQITSTDYYWFYINEVKSASRQGSSSVLLPLSDSFIT